MKYLKVMFVVMLAISLVAGCGKDKKENTPSETATGNGTTNAGGQATFNVGTFSVMATVQDSSHAGLPNIAVNGYLTHNNILLISRDPSGAHYSTVTVTGLTAAAKVDYPPRATSPDEVAGAAVQATIIMYPVQLAAYGYQTEPGLDGIVADDWTNEQCHTGIINDIYILMDTVVNYHQSFFIHLNQGVASAVAAPVRTAAFVAMEIDDGATFSSLMGLMFHLFEGDSLHYCQVSYGNTLLPIINIDQATIANRNFWAQFTLTWGENPYDLDSYLWTPRMGPDSTSYYINYGNPYSGNREVPPYADLDVDDVSSFGPEHVTIYHNQPGVYTYAVNHYIYSGGTGNLATSAAAVSLLRPDGSVQTFNVPTDTTQHPTNGWWWHVCTINGTTGAVTPINILSPDPPLPITAEGLPPAKPAATNDQ